MEYFQKEIEISDKKIIIELGKTAKQANGSCIIRFGDTTVLVVAVASIDRKVDIDFMPLTVDYRERTYAAGKIPGGFFKREARPKDSEILISRLIDRSIRPIFPKYWKNDTYISAVVLSHDGENSSDIIAILGASIALYTSDLPFSIPIASVRIGKINNKFVVNPSISSQKTSSTLDLVVSGTESAITMVEAGAYEISESEMLEALDIAKETIQKICIFQKSLPVFKTKKVIDESIQENYAIKEDIETVIMSEAKDFLNLNKINNDKIKLWNIFKSDTLQKFIQKYPEKSLFEINDIFERVFSRLMREFILNKKIRMDGRELKEVRSIACEIDVLPRVHGSSLFTRGQTQVLATVTLGTPCDMQTMDELTDEYKESFMLHYNFPGFATGEPRGEKSVSRREIGHGNLAKKALRPILPDKCDFEYTIRIVSDVLESNGSSSMASVCGGSLALFNAGIPVKSSCAGIAMGLIKENEKYVILTDINGLEDHFGDMDLKVAGTRKGITALQMDIKISGITTEILMQVLCQAKLGRFFILDKMDELILVPKNNLSTFAPRMVTLSISPDKIGELIGPGGKNIRKLQDEYNVKIDIDEMGKVFISGFNSDDVNATKEYVEAIMVEAVVGAIYDAKITKIMIFGAFAEILPGKEGLIHISQLSNHHTKRVKDVVKEGDIVKVKVIEIDKQGRINLSIKAVSC
ncbi:MAG: polyribonucleotide nucleotidyltransferase [Endomicrobium sp.]|nr:polyribonucleotide nucleotidyltransferase [Endomicrobium sp.]